MILRILCCQKVPYEAHHQQFTMPPQSTLSTGGPTPSGGISEQVRHDLCPYLASPAHKNKSLFDVDQKRKYWNCLLWLKEKPHDNGGGTTPAPRM